MNDPNQAPLGDGRGLISPDSRGRHLVSRHSRSRATVAKSSDRHPTVGLAVAGRRPASRIGRERNMPALGPLRLTEHGPSFAAIACPSDAVARRPPGVNRQSGRLDLVQLSILTEYHAAILAPRRQSQMPSSHGVI
jgi:hypothetical protein